MKKTLKKRLAMGAFAAVMGISMLAPVAGFAMDVKAFDDAYGKAAKVEKSENGSEIRYYQVDNYKGMDGYHRFEVRPDGKVIDRGFTKGAWDFILNQ